jgi:hypothetical protein
MRFFFFFFQLLFTETIHTIQELRQDISAAVNSISEHTLAGVVHNF